jgi:hypothetical protein
MLFCCSYFKKKELFIVANIKDTHNRKIQHSYNSYKNASQIKEALKLIRPYINVSTYKYLSHFVHTKYGVTQAKIKTICELSGISTGSYFSIVKKEIETMFAEPLIKREIAPRKYAHDRSKKVRASEFKILHSLEKIKELVEKKDNETFNHDNEFDNEVECEIESPEEIPCESKVEEDISESHKKSFKKYLLKRPCTNKLNITNNFIDKNLGKIKIKTSVKNYLNTFPLFRDFHAWTEFKRYEIAKTIQFAIIKTKTDIEEIKPQQMIRKAINRLLAEYQDKPLNEFLKLLYTFVFNALNDDQEDESEAPEDEPENNSDEPLSLWDQMKPTFRRLLDEKSIDPRPHQEQVDEINRKLEELYGPPASKQELNDMNVW